MISEIIRDVLKMVFFALRLTGLFVLIACFIAAGAGYVIYRAAGGGHPKRRIHVSRKGVFWEWQQSQKQSTAKLEGGRAHIDEAVCPYCSGRIQEGDVVCSNCYRDLKMNCFKCGAIVGVGWKFCAQCGAQLQESVIVKSMRR